MDLAALGCIISHRNRGKSISKSITKILRTFTRKLRNWLKGIRCRLARRIRRANLHNDREKLRAALGHNVSHISTHAPEMKPEQKQGQAVTPQREIAPEQKQSFDIGLGL
jgi:hypothetical protein